MTTKRLRDMTGHELERAVRDEYESLGFEGRSLWREAYERVNDRFNAEPETVAPPAPKKNRWLRAVPQKND